MKLKKFYSVMRYIASKQLWILQKKGISSFRSQWSEYHLKNIIGDLYEKNLALKFIEMQKERGNYKGWKARFERLDFMLCWVFLGAVPDDYFSMVFSKKGWIWRNHHVTRRRMMFIDKIFNPPGPSREILDDKTAFFKNWEKYMPRKWCVPEKTSLEEFEEKFKDVSSIIAKKRLEYGGKGVMVFDLNKTGYQEIFDKVLSQKEPYIIEEYHNQTGWLHDINPSSLNTIRVGTLSINGKTDVIFSYLRVGVNGSVVDNLHAGGIRFPIDYHTGKIFKGMDYTINGIERHPDTGIQLYGEFIPKWEEVLEFCKKAHESAPPDMHMIGWDVCLDEDDMSLIEGNTGPGFPPIENPHENWWKDMKNYLSQLES